MIKLYSYYRSSCSYRVRIALNLKNLDYETIPVHLVKEGGEQFLPEFKKLNPSSKVPVLAHEGKSFFQSIAIIEYLEDSFKEAPLYPEKASDKAHVRMLCEIINSDIQPLQNLRLLKKLSTDHSLSEDQKAEWIRYWIGQGFDTFEETLQKTAGDFCFGNTPGAADCFLIPQIYNALRFDLDMTKYPKISQIHLNTSGLEAFQKAHPNNQPDTPK